MTESLSVTSPSSPPSIVVLNCNNDFSMNEQVLKLLGDYYEKKHGVTIQDEDERTSFVFLKAYRDYHQGTDTENLPLVERYLETFRAEKRLPHFVSRGFDLLVSRGCLCFHPAAES